VTITVERPTEVDSEPRAVELGVIREQGDRLFAWVYARRSGLLIGFGILLVCGLVHGIGFDGYPGRINDDEGTYVAQAYAIGYRHSIAHYTYTYDHPFGGWLLMAIGLRLTGALDWATTAVTAGRLEMLVFHLVSCLLLYRLSLRLAFRRPTAIAAVALFSLSPLSVFYQRMAFLDNIAVMWLLAAMCCATSSRQTIRAALATGTLLAIAIWSKETVAFLIPTVFWLFRQRTDERNRRLVVPAFWGSLIGLVAVYPLFALIKGELFPGPGHVSLLYSLSWQLFGRPSSGSAFDAHSGAYGLIMQWVHTDPVLFVLGPIAAIPAFAVARLRPIAFGLLFQVVMLARGGYLPFAYVTAMLPFAALVLAGLADEAWSARTRARMIGVFGRARPGEFMVTVREAGPDGAIHRWRERMTLPIAALGVAIALTTGVAAGMQWPAKLDHALTTNDSLGSDEATEWFLAHEPRQAVVLTDDNIWTDLVLHGQTPDPVWLFKLDLDPAVKARIGGWQGIDYAILGPLSASDTSTLPTVVQVLNHSVVVKTFPDGYSIRKVVK
jgi:4-amino-4-deoxy-L-arabinose transferase-like glycosyltransferase